MLGLGSPEVGAAAPRGGDDVSLADLLGDFGEGAKTSAAAVVPASWGAGAGAAAASPAATFKQFTSTGAPAPGGVAAGPSLEDSPWEFAAAPLVRMPPRPRAVFLADDDADAPPLPRVPLGQPVAQPATGNGLAASKERLGALRPATAPGGGLARLPATRAPSSFYGAPARGLDPAGASSSAAAALRGGNPMLAALLQRKASGDAPAARPLRRDRSDASLPASDGARRAPAAKKRRKAVIDSEDDSEEEEEEAVTDSDGDTPAPKARPAAAGGAAGEAAEGVEGDGGDDEAAAEEEEGGSDSGASSGDEEELYGDTLEECGRIAAGLRSALGAAGSADRVAATDAGGSEALRLVTAAQVRAACTDGAPAAKAAACPELKGYQLVGVNFLLLLHTQGVEGAILADEMGCVPPSSPQISRSLARSRFSSQHDPAFCLRSLIPCDAVFFSRRLGKTAQAISFLAAVNARRSMEGHPPQPHMVIAPASVLENWARELDRWAPALRVVTYHGPARQTVRQTIEKHMARERDAGEDDPQPPFEVILCCYTMFERDTADQQDDRKWLVRMPA